MRVGSAKGKDVVGGNGDAARDMKRVRLASAYQFGCRARCGGGGARQIDRRVFDERRVRITGQVEHGHIVDGDALARERRPHRRSHRRLWRMGEGCHVVGRSIACDRESRVRWPCVGDEHREAWLLLVHSDVIRHGRRQPEVAPQRAVARGRGIARSDACSSRAPLIGWAGGHDVAVLVHDRTQIAAAAEGGPTVARGAVGIEERALPVGRWRLARRRLELPAS